MLVCRRFIKRDSWQWKKVNVQLLCQRQGGILANSNLTMVGIWLTWKADRGACPIFSRSIPWPMCQLHYFHTPSLLCCWAGSFQAPFEPCCESIYSTSLSQSQPYQGMSHRACRVITVHHNGVLPRTWQDINCIGLLDQSWQETFYSNHWIFHHQRLSLPWNIAWFCSIVWCPYWWTAGWGCTGCA